LRRLSRGRRRSKYMLEGRSVLDILNCTIYAPHALKVIEFSFIV
jgi:hypothetical protein